LRHFLAGNTTATLTLTRSDFCQ